jgi:hypothetical protein
VGLADALGGQVRAVTAAATGAPRRAFDWLCRDRRTGRVVIAQPPNAPLLVFFVTVALRALVRPQGTAGAAVSVVATVALAWWAVDEILRGVNPFRRLLGAIVLAGVVVRLVTR